MAIRSDGRDNTVPPSGVQPLIDRTARGEARGGAGIIAGMSSGRGGGAVLGAALRLGAAYDWLLALVILMTPAGLLAFLRFPPPVDPFLFRLAALPLLFFGVLYWVAAGHPGHRVFYRLSLVFRGLGGVVLLLLVLAHRPAGEIVYLAIAIADLAWALAWWLLGRKSEGR